MKINVSKIWVLLGFVILAFLLANLDFVFADFGWLQILSFPFFLLFLYFFTRYNENRYIYLSLFILVYFVIFNIPLFFGFLFLTLIFGFEKILSLTFNNFNIFQVFLVGFFIITLISIIYFYNLNTLQLFGWEFIKTNLHWQDFTRVYAIRLVLGLVLLLLTYPLLSVYESKHRLYLNQTYN